MPTINYQKICLKILSNLPQKQKEVIERRFGLKNEQRETLQRIGDDFGVTRERVRQIEREGFSRLETQKGDDYLEEVFTHFQQQLEETGGVKREDILLKDLGGNRFQNNVYFLLTFADPFHRFSETDTLFAFWGKEPNISQKIEETISNLLKQFKNTKKPLSKAQLLDSTKSELPQFLLASLEITKNIEQGPLGEFGLTNWPEIKPRGVRDAALLALKKAEEPLHFRDITSLAQDLPGEFSSQRQILPQTVHNELIRDERFVLVGRGIYALKEWGYVPGTVKDIIANILKKNKKPLSKEEILREVQEQRLVKTNTVFLNLADRNYFSRNNSGKYTLQK